MRLLITGGAGFIGSNFIRYILRKYPKYRVINLDKLTYAGNLDNLRDIEKNPRYKFIKGDIADKKIVSKILSSGVDVVINYAAASHVDRSILDPTEFIQTEVVGTFTLLEEAKKKKIKLYIQISTDECYGEIRRGKFKEDSPLNPRSPYAAAKAGADHLVHAFYVTYKLPAIIARSSNVYGPYQYPEKFIPLFITNLLENKKVPLYGKGEQIREWLYIEDHCRAIDLLMHKGKIGEIYNIASGAEKRNIDVAHLILKQLLKSGAYIKYVKDRPGHDFRYSLDYLKIKALGFKPKFQFENSLKKTIEWYQKNSLWWKKIKQSKAFKEYYKKQYPMLS